MPPFRRTIIAGLAAILTVLLQAGSLPATETVLAAPAALAGALRQVRPGTTLLLPPGDYGPLAARGLGGAPGRPLTLRAADPADPPVFTGLDLQEPAHLVLEGLVFDYRFAPGDPEHVRPFAITGGRDVTIRDALFDGDRARGVSAAADGYGHGYGLRIGESTDITLERSEIRDFLRGIVVADSHRVTIRDNDLHDLRSDGMNFAAVQHVRIEGNVIRDFRTAPDTGDHPDMIQFWTSGTTTPSTDIVIRDNLLSSGRGSWTQSIFLRNEEVDQGRAGRAMFYRDILIEENVILNAHIHGITLGETAGLTIRGNTLVRNARSVGGAPSQGISTPMIHVAPTSTQVRIERNVVAQMSGFATQADWQVTRNVTVQDRSRAEAGHYSLMFTGDPSDPSSFRYRAGGPLEGGGLGAKRLQP